VRLRSIKRYIPHSWLPIVRSAYRRYLGLRWRYTDLQDRRRISGTGFSNLPPAALRYRVHGSTDLDLFLRAGKRSSEVIHSALRKVGKDFGSVREVLDFGCGCGRTLLWFEDKPPSTRLYGTDIDVEAITWCREHLKYAEFGGNDALPPLRYPPEAFDLIYAISVFTHLDEGFQFRWLEELQRVTSPEGIVLVTLHGTDTWKELPRKDVAYLEKNGFKFVVSNNMQGIFPEWYQNAFHTKDYVLERYTEYFNVLGYLPRGMNNHQDVVILQKPERSSLHSS
jgi:SAM-dependent methyltransferase